MFECQKILIGGTLESPSIKLYCPDDGFKQSGVIEGVVKYSLSIGYTGLDAIDGYSALNNRTKSICTFKSARMENKAGFIVQPSIDSTQAAVRSRASALMSSSKCPGFGICGDLFDGEDQDVWPIVAVTASASFYESFSTSGNENRKCFDCALCPCSISSFRSEDRWPRISVAK